MTDIPEVTPEMMTERMLLDAQKVAEVSEIVSLNRDAIALIIRRNSKAHIPEKIAHAMTKIMFDALEQFGKDLKEAADLSASGEYVPHVVDVQYGNHPDVSDEKH